MADTLTTNYSFTKPEVAASDNTWGGKLNANWDSVDSILQDLEDTKADLASPTFTGTPAAPTAAVDTNTTQLATTAFVVAQLANDLADYAPLASPTFTGTPAAPTASGGTNTTQLATTAFVQQELGSLTAADIPIVDAGGHYTGTDVEAALQEAAELTHGQQTIWVPATAMLPRSTNGAAAGTTELPTNDVMVGSLDFDQTTVEWAQFDVQMPKSWNGGTVVAQFVWSHASGPASFGVVWKLQARAYADGDALDQALGTGQTAVDTGGTADDIYISPETSPITIAGSPAGEQYVIFAVNRVAGHGNDTLDGDARLHGVKLHYTTNAPTDD